MSVSIMNLIEYQPYIPFISILKLEILKIEDPHLLGTQE